MSAVLLTPQIATVVTETTVFNQVVSEQTAPQTLRPQANPLPGPADAGSDGPQLQWVTAQSAGRASLEQFIAEGFAAVYGARISHFMPHLLAVSSNSQWQAVLGIRSAVSGRLFVEQYVDADMEQLLQSAGVPCKRAEIAEIGNLYAASRQQTLLLFIAMALALHQQGIRHLVCCATPAVMSMLSRHGLTLHVLAEGDPSRLGAAAADWGSYYEKHPQICHLSLVHAVSIIQQQPKLLAMLEPWQQMLAGAAQQLTQEMSH